MNCILVSDQYDALLSLRNIADQSGVEMVYTSNAARAYRIAYTSASSEMFLFFDWRYTPLFGSQVLSALSRSYVGRSLSVAAIMEDNQISTLLKLRAARLGIHRFLYSLEDIPKHVKSTTLTWASNLERGA